MLRTCCDYLLLLLSFVIAGLSYGSILILPVLAVACLFERMMIMGQLMGECRRVMLGSIISILISLSSVIRYPLQIMLLIIQHKTLAGLMILL